MEPHPQCKPPPALPSQMGLLWDPVQSQPQESPYPHKKNCQTAMEMLKSWNPSQTVLSTWQVGIYIYIMNGLLELQAIMDRARPSWATSSSSRESHCQFSVRPTWAKRRKCSLLSENVVAVQKPLRPRAWPTLAKLAITLQDACLPDWWVEACKVAGKLAMQKKPLHGVELFSGCLQEIQVAGGLHILGRLTFGQQKTLQPDSSPKLEQHQIHRSRETNFFSKL